MTLVPRCKCSEAEHAKPCASARPHQVDFLVPAGMTQVGQEVVAERRRRCVRRAPAGREPQMSQCLHDFIMPGHEPVRGEA